jgi:hypothetical protein
MGNIYDAIGSKKLYKAEINKLPQPMDDRSFDMNT